MAWINGNQKLHRKFTGVNEEILNTKGYIDEKKAKILLYKFLRENPSFASELITGVSLFPFQHMAIKAMMETDYFLGIWCLEENEYVLTTDGFKKIRDVQVGDFVRSRDHINFVSDKKVNPLEKGLEIVTASGDSFKAKIGHQVLTYDDLSGGFIFKEIQDLTTDSYLPIKLSTDVWGDKDITEGTKYQRMPHLFYMLGYILGDGYVSEDGIHYCSEAAEVQDVCLQFIRSADMNPYSRQRTDNLYFYEYSVYNREFVKFLAGLGWDRTLKSKDKIICDEMLKASSLELCALVGGLFDADGYASLQKKSSKVGLKNSSIQMLRQVKMILNNLGIESNLRESGISSNGTPYYDLIISNDTDSLEIFEDKIGFIVKHKAANLAKIIENTKVSNYRTKLVPNLSKLLKRRGKSLSQNRFDEISVSDDQRKILNAIKKEGVYFSRVKSIKECDVVSVDITVEDEECYIGNGLVHHNSRGLSKSFTTGIFAILDAILNQGVHIGILSKSFRQCAHPDTLVPTDKGIVRIADINVGDYVYSINGANKVANKWFNEPVDGLSLTSKRGYKIAGKKEHSVLCLNQDTQEQEWKDLKDIKSGDIVAIHAGCNVDCKEASVNEKFLNSLIKSGDIDELPNEVMALDKKSMERVFDLDFNKVHIKTEKLLSQIQLCLLKIGKACDVEVLEVGYKISVSDVGELFWDKVSTIDEVKNVETVDIEVDNEHCYVGNGFVNHNSKMIFRKIEDIALSPKASLLAQCITSVSKSNDEWRMTIGRSHITALPLGDGEKLRGFRFQRMIIDELLLMPEKILNEVILPFLSVVENPTERQKIYDLETKLIAEGKLKEEDRHKWPHNKIIGLSSASFKFEYLFKLYQQYENLILDPDQTDNAHRTIMHLSYDCAPQQLYDANLLDQAKATMSEAQFAREFGSVFTDDSSGYFKVSKMKACTIVDGEGQSVEIIGDPKYEYVISFDPSWSESEGSDDFGMQVIKLNKGDNTGTVVHSYAMSGTRLKHHIEYFLYLYTHFNVVMVVGDYNGGVQFINSCNESEQFKLKGIQLKVIDADMDDSANYEDCLKEFRNQYNKENHKIVYLRKPSSQWIRSANEGLQAAFDHKRIWFAGSAMDDDFAKQKNADIPIMDLIFSRDVAEKEPIAKKIDFIEHIKDMIELIKVQCALIQVTSSAQGTQSFDLPYNLKKQRGIDKARKDSYSTLVLGNWGMGVYYDMININPRPKMSSFIPRFVK